MFRVINEYLGKVNLQANDEIYNRLTGVLNENMDIKSTTVTVNFQRYMVDIKLKKFSVEKAEEVFKLFNQNVSYSYSSLYVRFNEGKCVRYRYVTSKEDKRAFYCDIIIS